MEDTITLTCRLGHFIFDREVLLSTAKRIRDEVMGQTFSPNPEMPKIRSAADAEEFMRAHPNRVLREIPFDLRIIPHSQ